MKKILSISNDNFFNEEFARFFSNNNFQVENEENPYRGIKNFINNFYDLLVLDSSLEEIQTHQVIKLVKEFDSQTKIIVFAEKKDNGQELNYLKMNVDEYFEKGCSLEVCLERLKNILKTSPNTKQLVSKKEKLVIHIPSKTVLINNKIIYLSFIEFDLLVYLLENKNKVITRDNFLKKIWHEPNEISVNDPRTVDTHIKNLRKKAKITSIKTVRGVGYQWLELD